MEMLNETTLRTTEFWKPIPGYEGLYEISTFGRVKSLGRVVPKKDGRTQTVKEWILKGSPRGEKVPYLGVCLRKPNSKKTCDIHKLMEISFPCWFIGQKGPVIDHVKGDALDNRLWMLRKATWSQNNANMRNRNKTSKYKGLSFEQGKWRVKVQKDGDNVHIGYFEDEEVAARVYDEVATQFHGEYARLNFPERRGKLAFEHNS